MPTIARDADYRGRLSGWADRFALGQGTIGVHDLDLCLSPDQVRDFVAGNVDKRKRRLLGWCDLLAQVPRIGAWVDEYIAAIPLAAYDTARLDAGRLLMWIETHHPLTAEQQDCVACERGRVAVEERARTHRLSYVRFDELRSFAAERIEEPNSDLGLRLVLNPTRVWGMLKTRRFLDDDAVLPAHVLYFAVEGEVRTSVVEREGLQLLRTMEEWSGGTLDELDGALPHMTRDELRELCRDLAGQGILTVE